MNDEKKKIGKNEVYAIIMMGLLFVVIHGIALSLVSPFEDAGMQAFEDSDDPVNIVYILAIMLVFTLAILLIAKFWKKNIIQIMILFAIGYTAAYVFYPLLFNLLSGLPGFWISLGDGSFLIIGLADVLSIVLAIGLVYILYRYPEWYIIDLSGIVVGSGAIAIFGISLGVNLVLILLIILAIYDAISVYKTKHMVDLADTVMDLKLPVLMVIPKIRNYSLIKETKSLKQKIEDKEERDAFFLGLGDIVMPGILVIACYVNIPNGLPIALSVMAGTLVGFTALMTFVLKGNPQAGLPLLCSGAILGYVISSLILFGELAGLAVPSF
jgi:presenilin-like A22 family membrane protease